MKFKLEAISPMEGIGILRNDSKLRLVRPPYRLSDCPTLPENALEDAILRHGFFASQQEFPSWEKAIVFLREKVRESRTIPETIPNEDIINAAPLEVLQVFLERVETELIPKGAFDHAESFLLALLTNSVTTEHAHIKNRAASLLKQNNEARKQIQSAASEIAAHDLRFPSIKERDQIETSAHIAERIKEQHSIFAPSC
jgi:hypothetical protein